MQGKARRPSGTEAQLGQRSKPGYAPADAQGNFELAAEHASDSRRRVETEGCGDPDASERLPGGPVAEAVLAAGPAARRLLWLAPLAAFLGARLLQGIGLLAATHRYVYSVSHAGGWPEGGPLFAAEEDLYGSLRFEALGLRDNLAASLGAGAKGSAWLVVQVLVALVPLLWLTVVLACCNVRIWARTMAVGAILALLKGLCAWMTLIPEPLGWIDCRERLHPWALAYFQGEAKPLHSAPLVLWLWMQDLVFGMRGQDSLVCASSFSGPCYLCALFSLGLYDALRAATRRLRPWPRLACRGLAALLLAALALAEAWRELLEGRQYGVGLALALVLPLLLYSSPEVALGTDFFLRWGSGAKAEGGFDLGDVLVPPCCVPFCCLSGRYFLYPRPTEEVEELLRLRTEASKTLEVLRLDQEDGTWRVLELEAHLEYVRQRTQVRMRQDASEAERSLSERLLAQQQVLDASAGANRWSPSARTLAMAHEQRLAAKLSQLEAGKAFSQDLPFHTSSSSSMGSAWAGPVPERCSQAASPPRQQPSGDQPPQEPCKGGESLAAEGEASAQHQQPLGASQPARPCRGELTPFPDREACQADDGHSGASGGLRRDLAAVEGDFRSAPGAWWSSCHARFPSRRGAARAGDEALASQPLPREGLDGRGPPGQS